MSFKIGDLVTWRSQSAGVWKVKTGTVERVVKPRTVPEGIRMPGIGRHHESYVVRVADISEASKTRTRRYWPLVSKLKKVDDES